jgi:hypothetical protein
LNRQFSKEEIQMLRDMYEEILNIIRYKRNANQNIIEVPSHPSQHGYHQENKQQMLVRMWRRGHLSTADGNIN